MSWGLGVTQSRHVSYDTKATPAHGRSSRIMLRLLVETLERGARAVDLLHRRAERSCPAFAASLSESACDIMLAVAAAAAPPTVVASPPFWRPSWWRGRGPARRPRGGRALAAGDGAWHTDGDDGREPARARLRCRRRAAAGRLRADGVFFRGEEELGRATFTALDEAAAFRHVEDQRALVRGDDRVRDGAPPLHVPAQLSHVRVVRAPAGSPSSITVRSAAVPLSSSAASSPTCAHDLEALEEAARELQQHEHLDHAVPARCGRAAGAGRRAGGAGWAAGGAAGDSDVALIDVTFPIVWTLSQLAFSISLPSQLYTRLGSEKRNAIPNTPRMCCIHSMYTKTPEPNTWKQPSGQPSGSIRPCSSCGISASACSTDTSIFGSAAARPITAIRSRRSLPPLSAAPSLEAALAGGAAAALLSDGDGSVEFGAASTRPAPRPT